MNNHLTIAWLYPHHMSIYGDYGNVLTLKQRLEWRGFFVKVIEIEKENSTDLTQADIILMGGGQDREQSVIVHDFLTQKKPYLIEAHAKGVPALFACGGYQIMGHFYHPLKPNEQFNPQQYSSELSEKTFIPGQGADIPGTGIFNQYTLHFGASKSRCIGNIITEISHNISAEMGDLYSNVTIDQYSNVLVGFENHGGRTYFLNSRPEDGRPLGEESRIQNSVEKNNIAMKQLSHAPTPLGKVVRGFGNNGEDKTEGIVSNHFIGTYLHGFLMKNPHVADWLIHKAIARVEPSRGFNPHLEPLDDTLEWQTHLAFKEQILR